MHRPFCSLLLLVLPFLCASTVRAAPVIFFTDLTSGPVSGGEVSGSFSGAYVTIYGNFFGLAQGNSTITWNGLNCLRVVPSVGGYTGWGATYLWYQRIIVQLGSGCSPGIGNFIVTVLGQASNGMSFTTRSTGNIFFVSTTGSDATGTGSFTNPWRTVENAKLTMAAGDVVYAENGILETVIENFSAVIVLDNPGTAATPRTLAVYPGATATIGNDNTQFAFRACAGLGGCTDGSHWVIAGFTARGSEALHLASVDDVRFVGMDISCVNGDGFSGCFESDTFTNGKILGDHFHNDGVLPTSLKEYHHVYFTTNSNHHEVGWNQIHDGGACRGVQFFSTGGLPMFDIHVHDNTIFNTICDGINLATTDFTAGVIEAYNNLVYNVGTGPDPSDGPANYAGINSGGAKIYNNTFYNCGNYSSPPQNLGANDAGAITLIQASDPSQVYNNIIYAPGSTSYLSANTVTTSLNLLSGAKNNWFGQGNGPSQTTGNINSDPKFVNAGVNNFHLQATSPAIVAGSVTLFPVRDHDGVPHSSPPTVGAYHFPPLPTGTLRSGKVVTKNTVIK